MTKLINPIYDGGGGRTPLNHWVSPHVGGGI